MRKFGNHEFRVIGDNIRQFVFYFDQHHESNRKRHTQQVKLNETKSDKWATIPYAGNGNDSSGVNGAAVESAEHKAAPQGQSGNAGASFGRGVHKIG